MGVDVKADGSADLGPIAASRQGVGVRLLPLWPGGERHDGLGRGQAHHHHGRGGQLQDGRHALVSWSSASIISIFDFMLSVMKSDILTGTREEATKHSKKFPLKLRLLQIARHQSQLGVR